MGKGITLYLSCCLARQRTPSHGRFGNGALGSHTGCEPPLLFTFEMLSGTNLLRSPNFCVCLQQALLKEQLSYLDHLAEQLRREKEQEKEDEKVFKEERDRVWADKVERMKQEREARFQLLRDVVYIRQAQMEEKCKWSNTQLGRGGTTPCCWPSTHCVMEWTTMWSSLNLFPKCSPTGFPSTNSPLPSPEQSLVK